MNIQPISLARRGSWYWLALYSVSVTGLVLCLFYLSYERAFYFWDFKFYHEQTVVIAHLFGRSMADGARQISNSLNDDYNLLFTIPLVPFIWLFGASRQAFVVAAYLVYFVPFLVVVSEVARRIFPEIAERASRIAPVFALAVPMTWLFVVRGYPDIGGAAIVGLILLVYWRSAGGPRYRLLLLAGALGAAAILFADITHMQFSLCT